MAIPEIPFFKQYHCRCCRERNLIATVMVVKKYVTLSSGYSMPALGFGTWQATDDVLEIALNAALETGYRHIDTATLYKNEEAIGKVLKKWIDDKKLKREDLFIVIKLPIFGNRPSEVDYYINESLKKLQLDYVDLYLIHCPFGVKSESEMVPEMTTDILAIWKEMEKQVDNGKAKSIGISNFNKRQIEKVLKNCRIPPVTNQIELHAYLQQPELVNFMKENNIVATAYSSVGSPGAINYFNEKGASIEIPDLLHHPTAEDIARKHNKTIAQVLLRHLIQKEFVPIPKSSNPGRIRENFNVFDFELDADDMKRMNDLDRNYRIFQFNKFYIGGEKHPEYPFEF